jgi:drug/metabolite transporter (DMT)-like permease
MKIIHRNFCLFLFYFIFPLNLEYVLIKGIRALLGIGCFDGSGFFSFYYSAIRHTTLGRTPLDE